MKIDERCTLLLSTYDEGEDLWEGFFTSLQRQWKEMNFPIVMNTETKEYSFPGYSIQTYGLCKKKRMPWAKRLRETLKLIDSEFVLLFLEDYWLDNKVNDEYFRKCFEWMVVNEDIATVSFYPCMPERNIDDGAFEKMELRPQKCEYKLNCQVALWRKDFLIKYLRPHENPWEWEIYGSIRAGRYKERFYTLKPDVDLIFSYGDPAEGCIVHKGKWVKSQVLPLCELYNLQIDFSKRGFEDFDEYRLSGLTKPSIWERLKRPNRIKRIGTKILAPIRKLMSII